MSNHSGCYSASDGAHELTMVARQMVSDGYTQRTVTAFDMASPAPASGYGSGPDRALDGLLKSWFFQLDVDWILEIYNHRSVLCPHKGRNFVKSWIRAVMVIVASIKELLDIAHETSAVARFGNASISAMLVFVDDIVQVYKPGNPLAVLDMYICVSSASRDVLMVHVISSEAQSILGEIANSFDREGNRLIESIFGTVMQMHQTLMKDDEEWAVHILRGGGEVQMNIRFLVSYILLLRKAKASTENCAPSHNTEKLCDLIQDTTDYLKDLLLNKSELCSDPSLRYMFLLNNSYFIAQMLEPSAPLNLELHFGRHRELKLTPECEKHMDSYLDASWGHVLCYIPRSKFPGLLQRWMRNNTSARAPLGQFKSAFYKTYRAQKFWKVPDPQLRDALRKTIAERVVSGYRVYLKEHPELEEYACHGDSSPDELEEMLAQLFEG
ncbi:unnamed protein product [Triticum turgidum subsp. durum]|uniref:Exocyst subunit Exo70 family protein n=1 Tax=Triticum turgidum subsp. durum TaxID=4567 RepID=A0A9R1Q253_TRITD|nr:unnamed protein product [Triticum turgidum subsp. durum]